MYYYNINLVILLYIICILFYLKIYFRSDKIQYIQIFIIQYSTNYIILVSQAQLDGYN